MIHDPLPPQARSGSVSIHSIPAPFPDQNKQLVAECRIRQSFYGERELCLQIDPGASVVTAAGDSRGQVARSWHQSGTGCEKLNSLFFKGEFRESTTLDLAGVEGFEPPNGGIKTRSRG
jgi:hypothetical protein